MKTLLCVAALFVGTAYAQSQEEMKASCEFVTAWANQAWHISHTLGLPEDRWHITEDGYPKPIFDMILEIKREAYHDVPALRTRVELACGVSHES